MFHFRGCCVYIFGVVPSMLSYLYFTLTLLCRLFQISTTFVSLASRTALSRTAAWSSLGHRLRLFLFVVGWPQVHCSLLSLPECLANSHRRSRPRLVSLETQVSLNYEKLLVSDMALDVDQKSDPLFHHSCGSAKTFKTRLNGWRMVSVGIDASHFTHAIGYGRVRNS